MFTDCVTFIGISGEWSTCSIVLDTGATHSILPQDIADRLGVVAEKEMMVLTATGPHKMPIGWVEVAVGKAPPQWFKTFIGPPGDGGVVGLDVIRAFRLLAKG